MKTIPLLCIILFTQAISGQNYSKPSQMNNDIILVSAQLNCGVEEAFSYFTENSKLESWLALKANVEPEVGGKYELFWEPENPENNSTIGCKVLAVRRPYYINFEWKGPVQYKDFMNYADPLTNVTVILTPLENNKTEATLIHVGWRNQKYWHEARAYFDKGWRPPFSKLEALVNGD